MAVSRDIALRQMAIPAMDREQIAVREFECAVAEKHRASLRVINAAVKLREIRNSKTSS